MNLGAQKVGLSPACNRFQRSDGVLLHTLECGYWAEINVSLDECILASLSSTDYHRLKVTGKSIETQRPTSVLREDLPVTVFGLGNRFPSVGFILAQPSTAQLGCLFSLDVWWSHVTPCEPGPRCPRTISNFERSFPWCRNITPEAHGKRVALERRRLCSGRPKNFHNRAIASAGPQCCWITINDTLTSQAAFLRYSANMSKSAESGCITTPHWGVYNQLHISWTVRDIVGVFYFEQEERRLARRAIQLLYAVGKTNLELVKFGRDLQKHPPLRERCVAMPIPNDWVIAMPHLDPVNLRLSSVTAGASRLVAQPPNVHSSGMPAATRAIASEREDAARMHKSTEKAVCRPVSMKNGRPPRFQSPWQAPPYVQFYREQVGGGNPCDVNKELLQERPLLPVVHTRDRFSQMTPGVWMYYARGCSDVVWDAGKMFVASDKIDAVIRLMMHTSGCDFWCAWHSINTSLLWSENEMQNVVPEVAKEKMSYVQTAAHHAMQNAMAGQLCPTKSYRLAMLSSPGKPWDKFLWSLLKQHGYDSIALLYSPQSGQFRSKKKLVSISVFTELWDIREAPATTIDIMNSSFLPFQRFLSRLHCPLLPFSRFPASFSDQNVACKPTAAYSECMGCDGCFSGCAPPP